MSVVRIADFRKPPRPPADIKPGHVTIVYNNMALLTKEATMEDHRFFFNMRQVCQQFKKQNSQE